MSAQTISLRLPEEEVAILNLLSDRERRTKTQIIREALQPLFRKVLDEPERITLSNTGSVRISVSGEVIPGAAQRGCPLYLRCSMPDLMR